MPPPTSETRERARVVVVLRVLCAVARTIARRISRVTKREDAYVSSFFAEFVLLLFPFYLFYYICFSLSFKTYHCLYLLLPVYRV